MQRHVRVTPEMGRLLSALLDGPSDEKYGLDLMKATGLASGSMYPMLRRLARARWVEDRWEEQHDLSKGPRRRYYRLTADGVVRARDALAELNEATRLSTVPNPRVRRGRLA